MAASHKLVIMRFFVCQILLANAARSTDDEEDASSAIVNSTVDSDDTQCDRQCRWKFGPEHRNIIGEQKAWAGKMFNWGGRYCECYDTADDKKELLSPELIPREETKTFLPETWGGNFATDLVCTAGEDLYSRSGLTTMTRTAAAEAGKTILHCGRCAECSAFTDILVLTLTRKWITEVMTAVSADFAKPVVGHGDVARLQKNLYYLGMNFSMTRLDGRKDRSTCMDVWSDNIQSTGFSCKSSCFIKFFDSSNPEVDITKCDSYSFSDKLKCNCLKCDEENSGPAFINGAGANRRSSGIKSDIARPDDQGCPVGIYSNVAAADLPTAEKPSEEMIQKVLKLNR